jgi:hypothetical protein
MAVLVQHDDYDYLPDYVEIPNQADLPEEVSIWLESSQFIQSEEPEIIAKLEELIGEDNNTTTIAKTIGNFTGVEIDYNYATHQDALSTLQRGYGVCTGKSNLAAALFRAAGIPARIILTSPLPHFFVEYYVHPYGWVRSEATAGTTPIGYHWFVAGYCAYPEDETDSSYINGQNPGYGAVVYWGADNVDIFWDIVYSNCHRDSYNIEMTQEQINKAYNLSNSVWEKFVLNFNNDLTEKGEQNFNELKSYQMAAAQAFVQKNLQGFFDNLESALEGYQLGVEKTGNSFETCIFFIIISIIIILYRRKKKN